MSSTPTSNIAPSADPPANPTKLPLRSLLALATAVFVTSLTETLPAGVLPAMSADIGVGVSAMGQAVTIYALGTALTAVPLVAATAGWRRKKLLLLAMAGFVLGNTATALSSHYVLTMAGRLLAGVAAGLAWALLAGYARRLVPVHLQGKAIAVAMAGIPVALSFGVPVGTFIGKVVDWRVAFLLMTALALGVVVWIAALVPDFPGEPRRTSRHAESGDGRSPLLRAAASPGVASVLLVTLLFVLAHTVLYTYIATLVDHLGMGERIDVVLLVFGAASLASIWIVGARINHQLRALTLGAVVLVAVASALLALGLGGGSVVYLAAALWGLGWGGVPTLLQTAVGDAGGRQADAAQAMLVTLWNAAMAGGGVLGGALLGLLGPGSFGWSVFALLVPVLLTVVAARTHGFPARRPGVSA